MSENWLKRRLKQAGLIKPSQPAKQGLSLQYVYPANKKPAADKPALPRKVATQIVPHKSKPIRKVIGAPSTLIFLMKSMENLSQVCHYKFLHDIIENFLMALSQQSERNMQKVFLSMQYQDYRYKNLLHGWFGIKNDKNKSWAEILQQLKKFQRPLTFEDDVITQMKTYLIFRLTLAYDILEKSTPYLVHVIDMHLEKIHACVNEQDIQALFENSQQLKGKHSLGQLLYAYSQVPTYHLAEERLTPKPWAEIQAWILHEMRPIPVKIGVSLPSNELVS
jgi:hypothetical protein